MHYGIIIALLQIQIYPRIITYLVPGSGTLRYPGTLVPYSWQYILYTTVEVPGTGTYLTE